MIESVAIDGHVASGKSTIGKALAAQIGWLYLDTGAMYRAAAFLALGDGIDLDNEPAILTLLTHHRVDVVADALAANGYRVVIDGVDTGNRLFDPDVAAAVSSVARLAGVRERMVDEQRRIARTGPVVMAGRDIGTVVLPNARYKFFLTASIDERARRRMAEFAERGVMLSFDEVRAQVEERDRLDTTRAVAPLRAADDALQIDSTTLSPDDVIAQMRGRIHAAAR